MEKPVLPPVNNIPKDLRTQRRWVVWKFENRGGKPTKVPYNARTGNRAASNNPLTWSTFQEALDALASGRWSGIGFMLGDGFIGIDLDDCRNPNTGEIEVGAAQIIGEVASYTEISPSKTGIHIIAKGTLPKGRRRAGNIEMYDGERYFTITGDLIGEFREVEERQAQIDALHARVLPHEQTNPARTLALDHSVKTSVVWDVPGFEGRLPRDSESSGFDGVKFNHLYPWRIIRRRGGLLLHGGQ